MGLRVTGASALVIGFIVVLPVVGISSVGLSRSADWQTPAISIQSEGDFIGPQFSPMVEEENTSKAAVKDGGRNRALAESYFRVAPDFDPINFSNSVSDEKIEIQTSVLKIAYAQLLVSRLAAKQVLGEMSDGAGEPVSGDLILKDFPAQSVPPEIAQISTDTGQPNPDDILAPIPHERAQITRVAQLPKAREEVDFQPIPVEDLFPAAGEKILPPTPAPIELRPTYAVEPADVRIVQAARDVSVDRLVHVRAPGSWPRRLDTVGLASNGNIFMQNWGGSVPRSNQRAVQLSNGFMMVVGQ